MTSDGYKLCRGHEVRNVPGAEVHFAVYSVKGPDIYTGLSVPCRAKLHHALTGLFFNWDWKDEAAKELTMEEARLLSEVFDNQKEYKLWRRTLEKINELGTNAAREWFFEQVKVLRLRSVMKGK